MYSGLGEASQHAGATDACIAAQSMVEQLSSSPDWRQKFKLYSKAFLVFVALVIFWYAHYEILGDMLIGRVVERVAPAAVVCFRPDADEHVPESFSAAHAIAIADCLARFCAAE